jgi:hypothetical protein
MPTPTVRQRPEPISQDVSRVLNSEFALNILLVAVQFALSKNFRQGRWSTAARAHRVRNGDFQYHLAMQQNSDAKMSWIRLEGGGCKGFIRHHDQIYSLHI